VLVSVFTCRHAKSACVWVYITYIHTKFTIYVIAFGHAGSMCVCMCVYTFTRLYVMRTCVCVCFHICMPNRVYVCTCLHVHTLISKCVGIYHIYTHHVYNICDCISMCMYIGVYVHLHIYTPRARVCMYVYIHAYRVCRCLCVHVYMYTHCFTCVCTCLHIRRPSLRVYVFIVTHGWVYMFHTDVYL